MALEKNEKIESVCPLRSLAWGQQKVGGSTIKWIPVWNPCMLLRIYPAWRSKILAQLLGATIEILGVLAQPLAWRKDAVQKDWDSWRAAGLHCYAARCTPGQHPKLILLFIQSQLLDSSILRHVLLYFGIDLSARKINYSDLNRWWSE